MYLEKRLDFCVESPPLPVSELEISSAIPLEDPDGVQLLDSLLVVPEMLCCNFRSSTDNENICS